MDAVSEYVDRINVVHDRVQLQALVDSVMNRWVQWNAESLLVPRDCRPSEQLAFKVHAQWKELVKK